jgi:arabinofuranosyltransferase
LTRKRGPYRIDGTKVASEVVLTAMRGALGITGAAAGAHIHLADRYGIADPIGSRLVLAHRGRPGHEKRFSNAWLVGRFAEAAADEDAKITAARRTLGCEPLSTLVAAVREPMSPGRFIANLKGAFYFHTLRIPPDPFEAEETFCD